MASIVPNVRRVTSETVPITEHSAVNKVREKNLSPAWASAAGRVWLASICCKPKWYKVAWPPRKDDMHNAMFFLCGTLRPHACRQPISGAGCETNTIAQSSNNQSAKIVEIVLPQVGGLSRPHRIFKIATGQNVVMVNPKS